MSAASLRSTSGGSLVDGEGRPRTLERPWRVDAKEFQVPADVADALIGCGLAAAVQRTDHDLVSRFEAVHAGSDLGDRPGYLVPDDLRRRTR